MLPATLTTAAAQPPAVTDRARHRGLAEAAGRATDRRALTINDTRRARCLYDSTLGAAVGATLRTFWNFAHEFSSSCATGDAVRAVARRNVRRARVRRRSVGPADHVRAHRPTVHGNRRS